MTVPPDRVQIIAVMMRFGKIVSNAWRQVVVAQVRHRSPSAELKPIGLPLQAGVICAKSADPGAVEDCCLAAQNFMLAALDFGLATCPIGFA
jgi:nitroreductase